jgi:hypothetical protein
VAAFVTGSSLALARFLILRRLRRDERWSQTGSITLATGILANIPGLVLWISFFTTHMPEWEGLVQRLGLVFPLVWVEIMAARLLRLARLGRVESG